MGDALRIVTHVWGCKQRSFCLCVCARLLVTLVSALVCVCACWGVCVLVGHAVGVPSCRLAWWPPQRCVCRTWGSSARQMQGRCKGKKQGSSARQMQGKEAGQMQGREAGQMQGKQSGQTQGKGVTLVHTCRGSALKCAVNPHCHTCLHCCVLGLPCPHRHACTTPPTRIAQAHSALTGASALGRVRTTWVPSHLRRLPTQICARSCQDRCRALPPEAVPVQLCQVGRGGGVVLQGRGGPQSQPQPPRAQAVPVRLCQMGQGRGAAASAGCGPLSRQ